MPDSVVGGLLAELRLVLTNECLDQIQALFLFFEAVLQVVHFSKLVLHFILHLIDALGYSLHFFVDSGL